MSEQQVSVVFADEIVIEDQMVLTISSEKMFEEAPKRIRKSRWGAKPERKTARPEQQHLQFNPLEAMMNRKAILPMNSNPLSMLNLSLGGMGMQNALGMGNQHMGMQNQLMMQSQMGMQNPMGMQWYSFAAQPSVPQVRVEQPHPRWGPEHEKSFQPPSLNSIPPELSIDDLEYILRLYCLDDIYSKIQNNVDPKFDDPDLRSPSPEPIYDAQGKRVNTRDVRRKDTLLRVKGSLIEECQKMRKAFVAPLDYRPMKKQQKIYLTDTAYAPETNYIGLIIGPKGSTQKMLEGKTGCKISIRGKGSSNTKKYDLDSDDKLHVLIQAESDESLGRGVSEIERILSGENEDDMKKNQRLQLQVIQGVLRDDFCEFCHDRGHRSWACPSKMAWAKADVKCEICGELSHPTQDCPRKAQNKEAYIQSEFNRFMKDVDIQPTQQQQQQMGNTTQSSNRMNFITETQFSGFSHMQQLADDPEVMARLQQEEEDRMRNESAQKQALSQYQVNSIKVDYQSQQQQQQQQQQSMDQSAAAYQNNYYNNMYNPYMMYYGYQGQQYGQQSYYPSQQPSQSIQQQQYTIQPQQPQQPQQPLPSLPNSIPLPIPNIIPTPPQPPK